MGTKTKTICVKIVHSYRMIELLLQLSNVVISVKNFDCGDMIQF